MKFGTLQVYPRQGLLQEHGLDLPSSVIGRGEGSHILIDDFSIARRHARLTVDSGRLLVEDLGSVGGTFVNGERLEPGVRHLLERDAELRFGDIEARYLAPQEAEAQRVVEDLEDVQALGPRGLSALLVSPTQPIEAGKTVAATLIITNRGQIVDNVRVEIPELPGDWYTVETPAFPILPGGREEVKISLHPPRRHEALMGEYVFHVVVRSQEYDGDAEAEGRFEVLPFDSAEISLVAIRSKRKFRLLAENHGNAVARYELAGMDEEQVFRYDFETPAVELQPGEKRIIALAVRRPRKLFGPATQAPFEVVGKSVDGLEITARGQLAIKPPLQKFRMPVMFSLVALLLAVTAIGVLILTDNTGTKTANAEDPFAGVHLCEESNAKDDQAKKNADAANAKPLESADIAGTLDGGKAVFGQVDSVGAPFFAQNDPRWGSQEYAKSLELPNGKDWCGTTIEQCGCAMTSVSVMLALYNVVETPDGQPLSPKTLNDWFNGNAKKTDRGFVSRGYIYGDVIWTAANELSGEVAKTNPNVTTVRFAGTGDGSDEDIRGQLKLGRPVVVEVPGHWIAAVGIDAKTDQILINDPFYRDRTTLDVYKGKVRSSVHYEPSKDLSSVVITAPADVRFRVTDKQGRVVNTGDGTIEQPADVINQIPGASVASRGAWRDPTCIEKAPPTGVGTNQIVLPGSADDYTIEILGTGGSPGSVAIHSYGKDGAGSIATIEGLEGTSADVSFDPNADKPVIKVSTSGTPQATVTPSNGGGGAGGDDETPTPSPTLPPASPTATPFVEQRTAMTLPAEPGQSRVEVATNSGFELGDPIRFAPGLPNEEDNIIVGFGSFILATPLKFAHSPGEPIARLPRPPGQGPGLPPGITPPPDIGPIVPPEQLTMACSTIYQGSPKLATLICDLQVVGDYTTTRWTMNGKVVSEFTGSPSLIVTFPGDTPANVAATVCNQTLCRSTSHSEAVLFPPNLGGSTQLGPNANGFGASASPTPPPAGIVTVTCATEFPVTPDGQSARFTCVANFAGDFTSVSWSAPGGVPANLTGKSKEFVTFVNDDPNGVSSIKVTATVCNFGECRTSQPREVGISRTITILESSPADAVHAGNKLTLFARVQGLPAPGSKAAPSVPQGGTVQFYRDGNVPVGAAAPLFVQGSVAIAQTSVSIPIPTDRANPVPPGGVPHTYFASYSGGVNAFGSDSADRSIRWDPPIPDGCDSVNIDLEGADSLTDGTCEIATPKDIGAGTIISDLAINGQTGPARNTAVLDPGSPFTVTTSVSRTEYCEGCIRQVYLGIGGYDPPGGAAADARFYGPTCVFNQGGVPLTPGSANPVSQQFTAPTLPGVYYLRATTTLQYFCVGQSVGPPESSVGRIVVRQPVTAVVELWDGAGGPSKVWENLAAPRVQVSSASEGDQIVLRAKFPVGTVGRVNFQTSPANALRAVNPFNPSGSDIAPVATICPEGGVIIGPGTSPNIPCTPWEARLLTTPIQALNVPIAVTAVYEDSDQLELLNPADSVNNLFYAIRYPAAPPSNSSTLKILATPKITVTASPGQSPTPAVMGQPFTLTATVVSENAGLGLFGTGGTVQFMQGNNPIGLPLPITNADGTVSITWTPNVCSDAPAICAAAHQGAPFGGRDDSNRSLYNDVHAVFSAGTSDLKGGTSPNINVDIDPAPSTSTIPDVVGILAVSTDTSCTSATTLYVGDTICVRAAVTGSNGFSPVGQTVQLRLTGGSSSLSSATLGNCSQGAVEWTCDAILTYVTGVSSLPLDIAGSYDIFVRMVSGGQLATSDSSPVTISLELTPSALTVATPAAVTISTNAVLQATIAATCAGNSTSCTSGGTISFYLGSGTGTLLGTSSALTGSNTTTSISVPTTSGPLAAAGTYSGIWARYNGSSKVAAVDSGNTVSLLVNQATPALTLNGLSGSTHLLGDNLVLTGALTCGGGACTGVRSAAGATVSFYLGGTAGTLLGTDTDVTDGISFSAPTGPGTSFPTVCASANCYTNIVAQFNGNATNGNLAVATSGAVSATIDLRPTTASVTAGATAVKGTNITLNATVAPTTTPATAVDISCLACLQFEVNVGTTTVNWQPIGTAVDVATDGTATITRATGTGAPEFPNVQTYSIRAVYSGNAGHAGKTSGTVSATVTEPVPTVTVTATDVEFNSIGNALAVITPPFSEDATCSACVEFRVGTSYATGTFIGTGSVALVQSEYRASIVFNTGSTPIANAGSYTVWARYNGKTGVLNAATSATGGSFTVSPDTVTVVVTAAASVTVNSAITLTATLTPNTASGTIAFYADGVAISGAGSRSVTNGVATYSWTPTVAGTITISAQYTSTNTNYANQTASTNTDVIVKTTSSVAVSFSPGASVTAVTPVTLSAQVTAANGTGVLTCSACLQFRLGATNGAPIGAAQDVPASGTVTLAQSTGASTTFPVGTYTVYAVYTGSNFVTGNNGNADLAITANPVSVSISTTSSSYAKNSNITVSVTMTAAVPGSVRIYIDGSAVGSSTTITSADPNGDGVFDLVWNSPNQTGTHTVTVRYTSGTTNYQSPVTSSGLTIDLT